MKMLKILNTVALGLVSMMPFSAHSTPIAQFSPSLQTVDSSGTSQLGPTNYGPNSPLNTPYNGPPVTFQLSADINLATASYNNGSTSSVGTPSISTSASVGGGNCPPGGCVEIPLTRSSAVLSYYFTVIASSGGPASNVPVDVTGTIIQSTFGPTAGASVYAYIFDSSQQVGPTIYAQCDNTHLSGCNVTFSSSFITQSYYSDVGVFSGAVDLFSNAVVGGGYPYVPSYPSGFAQSLIDPYIYIDPTFLAANPGYSIVVSDGLTNNPPQTTVPEPASLALVGIGLIGLVGMQRRRRLTQ